MGGRSDFDGKATTDIRLAFNGAPVGSLPVCTNWCSRLTCLAVLLSVGAVACNQAPSGTNRSTASADPERSAGRRQRSFASATSWIMKCVSRRTRLLKAIRPSQLRPSRCPPGRPTRSFTRFFPSGSQRRQSNDPTRESLESPESVPETWEISPWTGDWYARADWEKAAGPELLRERRVPPPLRRRSAGRDR